MFAAVTGEVLVLFALIEESFKLNNYASSGYVNDHRRNGNPELDGLVYSNMGSQVRCCGNSLMRSSELYTALILLEW